MEDGATFVDVAVSDSADPTGVGLGPQVGPLWGGLACASLAFEDDSLCTASGPLCTRHVTMAEQHSQQSSAQVLL